jgi:hypothetical protein
MAGQLQYALPAMNRPVDDLSGLVFAVYEDGNHNFLYARTNRKIDDPDVSHGYDDWQTSLYPCIRAGDGSVATLPGCGRYGGGVSFDLEASADISPSTAPSSGQRRAASRQASSAWLSK